ncbi:MAG: hypothetical protein KC912_07285 [Proteobacteria bacterium]|nr:hypothetical protein [Pseudomonadota bacterium]
MPTFLQLAPEQGGTRFGPFPSGVIQLGSAARTCQIVLNTPGVAPVHAMITAMGGGSFTVQPTQQGLGLFLMQRGQTHLWPVEAPITASAGDRIFIGSPEGAAFDLQWQEDAPAAIASGPTSHAPRPGNSMGSGIAAELQRQAFSKTLAKAGPLREIYHLYYRARSGALSNPRVLLSILGSVAVGLMTLATGCAGLLTALFFGD